MSAAVNKSLIFFPFPLKVNQGAHVLCKKKKNIEKKISLNAFAKRAPRFDFYFLKKWMALFLLKLDKW